MSWATLADELHKATRDAFGESMTFTPAGGTAESISAIFNDNAESLSFLDGVQVISAATVVEVRISDLSRVPAEGDSFTIGGTVYTVAEVWDNGQGGARCKVLR